MFLFFLFFFLQLLMFKSAGRLLSTQPLLMVGREDKKIRCSTARIRYSTVRIRYSIARTR